VSRRDPVLVEEKFGGADDVWAEMYKPHRLELARHILQATDRTGVEIIEISRLAVGQSQQSGFQCRNIVAGLIAAKFTEFSYRV
jgi:hypothetical protein